ncbi:MAG: glycosyltransferase [Gemmatimonadota bacterium]
MHAVDPPDAPPNPRDDLAATLIGNTRVLRESDSVVHAGLSVAALCGIFLFMGFWIREIWPERTTWLTPAVGLLLFALITVWLAQWFAVRRMVRPVTLPVPDGLRVAAVTTFVESHESLPMLERTLSAMCAMRGPHDVWLLAEQDVEAVRTLCRRLGVQHFSREAMPRYQAARGTFRSASKHGNYNAWLTEIGYADYDVLAMFDPDHVPEPSYLERTLGYLTASDVGFVQPPQFYYNQPASFVARAAAEESYGYYSTQLMASYSLGHAVVIGSHGVHRLQALREVGGLPAHDAEDLYLTILYRAAGWLGVYVPDVLAMGTTPIDWAGYLRQQLRWSRSLIDLKLRVLPRLSLQLPHSERLLNLLHGAYYLRALCIPAFYLMLAVMLVRNVVPPFMHPRPIFAVGALFALLAVIDRFRQRYYLDPPREHGFHWRATLMQFVKWPVFVRATFQALRGLNVAYLLTPKGRASPRTRALAPVQLGVATCITAAAIFGTLRHGELQLPIVIAAAVVVGISIAIAWSDSTRPADYTSDELYLARRRAMNFPER